MAPSPSLRRLPGRVVTAVLLALHVAALGVAPLAEAAEARRGHQAHVEAQGTRTCPPGHNDVYCQLYRVLTGAAPAPAFPRLAADRQLVIRAPADSLDSHRSTLQFNSPLGARAPPFPA